ncbi:MAG TPA: 4-hydroxy-tetrahydrodipicolinate synthase [Candidatus Obscuribacterales bacterium]
MPERANPFGRVLTAMVTPFDAQLELDPGRVRQLADHLLANGTESLVATGTTGEAPTLEHEEKLSLWRILRAHLDQNGSRAKLITGTGSYSTKAAVRLSLDAQECGADALLVVNPYYNKPNQEGLLRHFEAIAEAVTIPIVLYNHPGRTGVSLETATVCKLAAHPRIVAIKDSSCNFAFLSEVRAKAPQDFLIFSGDDPLTLPILAVGGDGVISVASHVAGKQISRMVEAFFSGDIATAQQDHLRLLPLAQGLFCAPSPSPVKYALERIGISVGGVRLPLTDLDASKQQLVNELLQALHL